MSGTLICKIILDSRWFIKTKLSLVIQFAAEGLNRIQHIFIHESLSKLRISSYLSEKSNNKYN